MSSGLPSDTPIEPVTVNEARNTSKKKRDRFKNHRPNTQTLADKVWVYNDLMVKSKSEMADLKGSIVGDKSFKSGEKTQENDGVNAINLEGEETKKSDSPGKQFDKKIHTRE